MGPPGDIRMLRTACARLSLRPLQASCRAPQIRCRTPAIRSFANSSGNKATATTASRAQIVIKNFRDMTRQQKKELGKKVLGWSAFAFGGLVVFRVFTDT